MISCDMLIYEPGLMIANDMKMHELHDNRLHVDTVMKPTCLQMESCDIS